MNLGFSVIYAVLFRFGLCDQTQHRFGNGAACRIGAEIAGQLDTLDKVHAQ